MVSRNLLFTLFVVASTGLLAKPQSEWLQDAQKRIVTEVLPNGLAVVCYPIPGHYNVHVGITYDVGSKDERPGEYGLAHMIEHMIFKGTEKMSESDLIAIAEKFCVGSIGQGFNAFTSRDTTRYYFNTDKHNYGVFLDILADCMFNVRFDENHFASEVKAVIEELHLRENKVGAILYDELSAMMFPFGHPSHHSIIGTKETLLAATTNDLKAFYKRNYHPSRAVLVIAGDIDCKKALSQARAIFNVPVDLPKKAGVIEKPFGDAQFSRRKLLSYRPIAQPFYAFGWRLPKGAQVGLLAHSVAEILSHRLNRALVFENDLALDSQVGTILEREGSFFIIAFTPKSDRSVKEIKLVMQAELDTLMNAGPTASELVSVKKSIEKEFLTAFETPDSVASLIEKRYFPDGDAAAAFKDLACGTSFHECDVKAFVLEHLRPSVRAQIECLPLPDEERDRWEKVRREEDAYEQSMLAFKVRKTVIEQARHVHTLPEPQIARFNAVKPDRVITLSNGLEVCLKRRESTPYLSGAVCFKDAELFESMITVQILSFVHEKALLLIEDGSEKRSRDELREFFYTHGAEVTFTPSGCEFSCAQDAFVAVGQEIVSMIKHPLYDAREWERHVASHVEGLQAAKKRAGAMAGYLLGYELCKAYPWTMTIDEMCGALSKLTRDNLMAHNKQYFNPENMFLVLVGNFDDDTIAADLEKCFGAWNAHKEGTRWSFDPSVIPDLPNLKPREIIYPVPDGQIWLALGRVTTYAKSDVMYALSLIDEYVQKKFFEIREGTGLFYAHKTSLADESRYFKGIAQTLFPLRANTMEAAEKAIKLGLSTIAQEGIPEEFIKKAKEQAQMTYVKAFSSNTALCRSYARLMGAHEAWDTPEKELVRFQALTKDEIDATARLYLDPSQWTTVKAGRIEANAADDEREASA